MTVPLSSVPSYTLASYVQEATGQGYTKHFAIDNAEIDPHGKPYDEPYVRLVGDADVCWHTWKLLRAEIEQRLGPEPAGPGSHIVNGIGPGEPGYGKS